jgi:hypothetical protein
MIPSKAVLDDANMADWYQERIEEQISDYLDELKNGEKLAVSVILNNGQQIQPTWFGYHNPNMLIIDGVDENQRNVRILVPHTSTQILMTVVPEDTSDDYPRIGFQARIE